MGSEIEVPFQVTHPEWIEDATIYEVHLRQFTKSGTLAELLAHLPRIKDLGVQIIWLMPVQPIGTKNRKGQLGSPYSIRDFVSVSEEVGSMDDMKQLVDNAHKLGMHVILDWVANHTAWDHFWIEQHPDFYNKDMNGNIIHPANTDWFDVADLNFNNPALRNEMIESLKFWIQEADIDGFRCDMAGLVPVDFWNEARTELDKLKPVLMLAEAEQPEMHYKAFDITYNWACHHLMNEIARGHKSVFNLDEFFFRDNLTYPQNAIRLNFTCNHDENKNVGSAIERLGPANEVFSVLAFTMPGIPLIFGGQEAGLNRKLLFFDKDEIDWRKADDFTPFFRSLVKLKKDNKAIWSGTTGGTVNRLFTNRNDKIFAFSREKDGNIVLVILNLSCEEITCFIDFNSHVNLVNYFSQEEFFAGMNRLGAWEYKVFTGRI